MIFIPTISFTFASGLHYLNNYHMFGKNPVMKKTLSVLLVSMVFAACDSANNQRPSTNYETKKTSLEDMERESPLKFLKITASHRGNLINQEVVEGEVINKATLMTYKNIEIRISFLDNEGGVIEKQKHTLDDVIKPNSSVDFKIKTGHIKGAASISADIISAIADK